MADEDDAEIRLKVVYDASPQVKQAADDVRKLKDETSALNAVLDQLEKNNEEVTQGFVAFHDKLATEIPLVENTTTAITDLSTAVKETTPELDNLTVTLYTRVAPATRESADGFGTLARQAFQAERVITAMASGGGGLARAAPLLDNLVKAMGGPAGLGFVIIGIENAVERVMPALEKLWNKFNDIGEVAREARENVEHLLKGYEKLAETPAESARKTSAMVTKAITEHGGGAADIAERVAGKLGPIEQFVTGDDADLIRRYRREQASPEARMEAAMHGQALVSGEQVESAMARARTARMKQAEAFVGQLATSRPTRDTLRQMGVMGGQFMTELDLAEPEAQAEQKQIVAAEHAAGQEMKTWGTRRKAEIKAEKADVKYDEALEQMIESGDKSARAREARDERNRVSYNAEVARMEEGIKRESDAAHAKAVAAKARHDAKSAREGTPQAIAEHREKQETGEYLGAFQSLYPDASTELQKAAARHARENHQAGIDMAATMKQAADFAMEQARADMRRGVDAGLKRMYSGGEMRGQ